MNTNKETHIYVKYVSNKNDFFLKNATIHKQVITNLKQKPTKYKKKHFSQMYSANWLTFQRSRKRRAQIQRAHS